MSKMMHVRVRACAAAMGAALPLLLLLSGCATFAREGPAGGQEVAFFPSVAYAVDGDQWCIRIQGRIFEPPDNSWFRQKLIDTLALRLHADPNDKLYRERAGYFVSDSIRNAQVSVRIGNRTVRLPPSNATGYFATEVPLLRSEVEPLASDGVVDFSSLPTGANSRLFPGTVTLVPEEGVTVVTDIDDTIKITNMRDAKDKEANTFLHPFRAVPGMPERYRAWKQDLGERIHDCVGTVPRDRRRTRNIFGAFWCRLV
jgi:hypothetical protein